MAVQQPLWRRAFDTAERTVAGPLEGAVKSDVFADGVALAFAVRRRVGREVERQSRRALHRVNLPAASDMRRISQQLAVLERQVRSLSHELEDLKEDR